MVSGSIKVMARSSDQNLGRERVALPTSGSWKINVSRHVLLPYAHICVLSLRPSRKTVENIPTFLRRSDIGQFVTCDELILPWRRRGGGSIVSSSFQNDS